MEVLLLGQRTAVSPIRLRCRVRIQLACRRFSPSLGSDAWNPGDRMVLRGWGRCRWNRAPVGWIIPANCAARFDRNGTSVGGPRRGSSQCPGCHISGAFRGAQGAEPWDRTLAVEVPLVVRHADKVADRRIGRPGTAQRCAGQVFRYTRLQEHGDVAFCIDRFDGRQARQFNGWRCVGCGRRRR